MAPVEICRAALAMGMDRLALTDRNGVYGIPHFLEVAREEGVRPIIGAEALTKKERAVLLARNKTGYSNLCHILSDIHSSENPELCDLIAPRRDGLIVISDSRELLVTLKRSSPEGLFAELSPGHNMHRALSVSRETGIAPVATTRAVFLKPEDIETHRVLRAIALNTKLSRLPSGQTASDSDFFRPASAIQDYFPHCPEAIHNTVRIADLCRDDWDFSGTVFPAFRGMSDEEACRELERRSFEGAVKRYGGVNETIGERLRKELTVIGEKGFAHYFLVVEELAKRSPRTCGRGSAAASLVSYCLGITHVDPIRHNLFFERFLNPGRVDPPDIDIDFPWDERDDVLDFAFARYGAKRAAMVANQVGFGARSALREVAKVYGVPEGEIKTITRRISGFWKPEQTEEKISTHPLFANEKLSGDWRKILSVARRLSGKLRHLSLHCGGLVVVPDRIRDHVPVEISAKGLPVIQWEKDQAEASGLVKIDILGNRSLAVIRDAIEAVCKNTGEKIDYGSLDPLQDEKTRALIRTGRTMGCFYIESPATRQLLMKMWGEEPASGTFACDLFEHLVMASSIIRPAANAFIREFVARMRGKPFRALHPLLEDILAESYGIAIYQEHITQMAMALADFSPYHGDQLRKIISKKHKGRKLDDYRKMFMSGGRNKGVCDEVLDRAWEQILSFGGYSFCKPHSASYALVSCKSAYLKANHPAEFMASVISNQGGFYSTFAYLSEARRMGLAVLGPDINESLYHYTGSGGAVRVGFMQINGLTRRGKDLLMAEREREGTFACFEDFIRRTALDPSDVKLLIKAGCFDSTDGIDHRPGLLWKLLAHCQKREGQENGLLFDEPGGDLPDPPPYDEKDIMRQELETLDMLISRHPLDVHADEIEGAAPVKASEMGRHKGRPVTTIGWWVTAKVVQTKNGKPMEFVTFEDTTGIYDTTFFPEAYRKFCKKLT
ncbi:MAG: DNA polymerase III subunit alpha, partial [bacterium]